MAWWHCPKVCRVWQGTVFGIAVDLSALPYLLRLILGSSLSWRPRLVIPSWLRPCRLGKNHERRSGVSPVGKGGWSRTVSPPWLGLPVGDRIVLLACHYVSRPTQACAVVAPPAGSSFVGKRVHWGPQVYEPDRSPRAPLGLLGSREAAVRTCHA